MKRETESPSEALSRVSSSPSLSNYPLVLSHFSARGIPLSEIDPKSNVLTFRAWIGAGRVVRKGEHGCKIPVLRYVPSRDESSPPRKIFTSSTVFHISQTDPLP